MINPKLKKGDRIILLQMDGEPSMVPGDRGTVTSHSIVFGDDQYSVNWDSGRRLALISSADAWMFEKDLKSKKINESDDSINKGLFSNAKIFKNFNMKFLKDYLLMIRDSGIVNMFGASPYLYLGKDRIENEFKYRDVANQDEFEQVLENADKAQGEMINGVIKILESEGKEVNLENINRYLSKYSIKVLETYIYLF